MFQLEEDGLVYTTTYDSQLVGSLTLASDGLAVTGLWLEGQKYFRATIGGPCKPDDGLAIFRQARAWLDRYFAGERPQASELPLAPSGTEYRQRVWRVLLGIPYGQTRTYGEVARLLESATGTGTSARAVGAAVGRNPISIIIPCHRVIGADGSLTGYAGGIDKKALLLAHEETLG